MPIRQEKLQVTAPGKIEAGEGWSSFEANRRVKGTPYGNDVKLNKLPPGMDITNQQCADFNNMPLGLAGSTDVSDDVNTPNLHRGFTKKNMLMTDDQYNGERQDLFYGDAGGFIERNNYLDRE